MIHSTPPCIARDSLRRLATPHALAFGSRLLRRGSDGTITFREFLAVARELVARSPEQSAIYLATLVALDMASETGASESGASETGASASGASASTSESAAAACAVPEAAPPSRN